MIDEADFFERRLLVHLRAMKNSAVIICVAPMIGSNFHQSIESGGRAVRELPPCSFRLLPVEIPGTLST